MRETHKFELDNDNCITISEHFEGEYAEDQIMILLEGKSGDSMALLVRKSDARGIGKSLMQLGYVASDLP